MRGVPFYRLFGSIEVIRDGRPIQLGGPKQRAVLAALLLDAGRVVSVDRLAGAVWGDEHPPSMLSSLHAHISNLRRLLRDDERATSPIVRRTPGYLADVPPDDLDLRLFERECDRAQAAADAGDWPGAVAAALLRTSGSWPWAVYGDDPAPLLARLAGLETLVAADPAAHVRVLAALAVGSAYDPDGSVPDLLSRRAIELAERIGDDEALADALLGRALVFSGVAERAAESVELLDRLAAVPHASAQIDEVIAHGLLYLAKTALGDPGSAEHVRLGALGSGLLRLPASRVQFRWAQGSLALWRDDDLTTAAEIYHHAFTLHRETELYESGAYHLALLALSWEQGRLDEPDEPDEPVPGSPFVPWAPALTAVARGDPDADKLLAAEIAQIQPVTWTTHARLTMLAHAVADLGLRSQVATLTARLTPLAHCVANIGQCGFVGTVALGLARLAALDDDLPAAREHLRTSLDVATRAQGVGALLRCRLFAAELAALTGDPVDLDDLRDVADRAARRGMIGVARDARTLLARHTDPT